MLDNVYLKTVWGKTSGKNKMHIKNVCVNVYLVQWLLKYIKSMSNIFFLILEWYPDEAHLLPMLSLAHLLPLWVAHVGPNKKAHSEPMPS